MGLSCPPVYPHPSLAGAWYAPVAASLLTTLTSLPWLCPAHMIPVPSLLSGFPVAQAWLESFWVSAWEVQWWVQIKGSRKRPGVTLAPPPSSHRNVTWPPSASASTLAKRE